MTVKTYLTMLVIIVVFSITLSITLNIEDDDNYQYIYEDIEDIRITTTIKHLLHYVLDTKKGDLHHLKKCEIVNNSKRLFFDNNFLSKGY